MELNLSRKGRIILFISIWLVALLIFTHLEQTDVNYPMPGQNSPDQGKITKGELVFMSLAFWGIVLVFYFMAEIITFWYFLGGKSLLANTFTWVNALKLYKWAMANKMPLFLGVWFFYDNLFFVLGMITGFVMLPFVLGLLWKI